MTTSAADDGGSPPFAVPTEPSAAWTDDAQGEPMPKPHLDPDAVHSPAELAAALDSLRMARNLSYADLNKAVRPERLPQSTLNGLLSGKAAPRVETLELFLRACGIPRPQWEPWRAARERALSEHAPVGSGAVRVSQAVARRLGVHKAIEVDGAPGSLPIYVERDTDTAPDGIRARLRRAMDGGGMVVLVGGSSVGKTRCAYEAIRTLMPAWWLVHPADATQLRRLAEQPHPRTVVWLDELQTYLDSERGLTAATVRILLGAGLVVVATLWPEHYTAYTTPPSSGEDRYRAERQVLQLAEAVHLKATLSALERVRAEQAAEADPRIRMALQAADYGMTQVLAAAPQLIDRWHGANAYAKAVLCAAVDAVRLGVQTPLSADMLRTAAPGYCTPRQKADAEPNWFETAMAYATEPLHGAAAALAPVAVEMGQVIGYTVADYLRQHTSVERGRVKVPASTWDALVRYLTDPTDQLRVAYSAHDRLLYCYADPLYVAAADATNPYAQVRLSERLVAQDKTDEAIAILRPHADAGDSSAASDLAFLLSQEDRVDELRERANAGDTYAATGLALWLLKHDKTDEATAILHLHFDVSGLLAAEKLIEQGRIDELRKRADAGDLSASVKLSDWLAKQGRTDELHERADTGDADASRRFSMWLIKEGRIDELRKRADAGDLSASVELSDWLAKQGRTDELRERTDTGDTYAATSLIELLQRIDPGEADRIRRFGLSLNE